MEAGGEVVPFDRSSVPAVREEYVEAIQLWCQTRDTAEILSREEIGAMRAFDRVDAQRKAIILSLAHYYRKHERSDVAPGVAVVMTLMSDNDEGVCKITQPMMAKLFGRSVSSIGDAQRRLKEDEIIIMGRGRYAKTYPAIPRAVTKGYNHMAWLISAACEPLPNLPAPPVDCQTTGPTGGLNQSTGRTSGLENVNQPVESISINRPDPIPIHYKNSVVAVDRAAAVLAAGIATAMGALPAAAAPVEPPSIVQQAKLSMAQMSELMMDAAGTAIDNPARCPGLLIYSDLQQWLSGGCDFEADILPTIRAVCTKAVERNYAPITGWSYFTKAIANAKAKRLAPMPEGRPPASRFKSYEDEEFERRKKFLDFLSKGNSNG